MTNTLLEWFLGGYLFDSPDIGSGSGHRHRSTTKDSPGAEIPSNALDNALVERIRNGDLEAMNELFDQYFVPLVGFAHSFTKHQDVAEDLVQDALLAIWERRNVLSIRTSLANYLFSAVRYAALNQLRSDKRRGRRKESARTDDDAARNAGVAQPTRNADVLLEEAERARLLRSAIDSLPSKYRQVLSLRANGFSYEDVASVLGLPAKTVQTRVLRGISMLRASLQNKF